MMKPWQISLNEHPTKGEKKNKERGLVRTRKTKTQRGSQRGKGTNYVLEPPLIARSILEKEKERKLERIINLKNGPHM